MSIRYANAQGARVAWVCLGFVLALSTAAAEERDHILLPDSSLNRPADFSLRAHTNHLMRVREQVTGTAPAGETPASIRGVYGLPSSGGGGVIAIVDAYHYPTALSDFNVFAKTFGLPVETSTNAMASTNLVFQVVYASGKKPVTNAGWSQEAALDIEWAHAMAPGAKIVLVEASSASFSDLFHAVDVAGQMANVHEISMSWGGSEFSAEASYDSHLAKPGIVYVASSGDSGGQTIYPAVSPQVVAAGGTSIVRDATGAFVGETGWSGSGGGPSLYEPIPPYQSAQPSVVALVGARRGTPDFSFDADPKSGVSVYDTTAYQGYSGWLVFGGTSVASPSLAGIINLAGTAIGAYAASSSAELQMIYSNLGNSSMFRDITSGTAGSFTAASGWDLVTGVGSDQGLTGK